MNLDIFDILEKYYALYHKADFLENDPLQIPHLFQKKQDIEISGFFASIFAWGKRKIIINKSLALCELMDNAPHDFVKYHTPKDLQRFTHFSHRTFNNTDLLYFLDFLKRHYTQHECFF
jgi:uncharacterized protein (TIGR02757 family)